STILRGDVCPAIIRTPLNGRVVISARNRRSASFALPSTGGAANCNFHASPSFPQNAVRFAPERIFNVMRAITVNDMRTFESLTDREILALAISLEEADERIYADYAE